MSQHSRSALPSKPMIRPEQLPLVLVGLPGAGKTTVARLLSAVLGVQVTDTDAEIRRRARMTIPQIFATEGEDGFRDRETRALRDVLESPSAAHGIVALGGGAVLRPENRRMLRNHTVIHLAAHPRTAAAHVGTGEGRPLVNPGSDSDATLSATDPQAVPAGVLARMEALDAARRPLYEEIASVSVPTDGLTPAQVTALVLVSLGADPASTAVSMERAGIVSAPAAAPRRNCAESKAGTHGENSTGTEPTVTQEPQGATVIHLPGSAGYDVVIGRDLGHRVTQAVLRAPGHSAGGVGLIHPQALGATAERFAQDLRIAGLRPVLIEVPDGEGAKSAEVLAGVWERLGDARIGRDGCVIGLGGGAATDLAGFAGATWLRGVPVVQVPTTLLAMVDAAVGGKTGIDTASGKNLVGAFHAPSAVVCDLDTLRTLPERELRAGLGEVIKCGLFADPEILSLVNAAPEACLRPGSSVLADLVRRSVVVKAEVVAQDLKESGLREVLNYGHTYAHAIERVTSYTWRHGEAVAVGCVFAAEVAHKEGRLTRRGLEAHREVLAAVGLPVAFPEGRSRWEDLREAMALDKKNRGGRLRMVLVEDRFGQRRVVRGIEPEPAVLAAAHEAVTAAGWPSAKGRA